MDREVRREGKSKACHSYSCAEGCCDLGEKHRCTMAYAVAVCRVTAGEPISDVREELRSQGCEAFINHEVPELGLRLAASAPMRHADPATFVEEAGVAAAVLSDPTRTSRPDLAEFIARRLTAQLKGIKGHEAYRTRRILQAVAERPALLEALTRMSHPRAHETQVSAHEVEGWRRVLVTRISEGRLLGFELVASAMESFVQVGLRERDLDESLFVQIYPTEVPRWWLADFTEEDEQDFENRVASWAFLRETDMAWRMALLIRDEGDLAFMSRSRSSMYMWALVLIVFALVVGIGSTVRAVIREARLSRLKTDFVSSVSHDLRTPLTSIRMFTETLLLGRVSDQKEEHEFLQVIADEAERLSRLTERILDFSRMEAGRKTYAFHRESVSCLIRQALAACRPMITEAGLEVETELEEDLPSIHADRDAMIEVLINLVTNAIKYSSEQRLIRLIAWRESGQVAIAVQDFGIGIPRAEQKRIFEKFYRVDCRRTSEVGGSGIGLSLVDHIVSAHRGDISADSALGEGSTFTVRLPEAPQLRTTEVPSDASLGVETWKASSS